VITDAALRGAARDVVLHPEALEDLHVSGVHLDRDGDDELPLGIAQDAAHRVFKLQVLGGQLKLLRGYLEGVQFFVSYHRRKLLDHLVILSLNASSERVASQARSSKGASRL
jgi:hypothetical protein